MEDEPSRNSNVLTQVRQTWHCFKRQCTFNVNAYIRMFECFKENLRVEISDCLEWIKCTFLLNEQRKGSNYSFREIHI